MATLTDDEMKRVRAELGSHVLSGSAEPLIGLSSLWALIRDNVESSSVTATTSSTTVSAAGPTTITLASATGYAAGQAIQIDSDAERETVTIRSLSGTSASVICRKAHSGTYPVEVESGLTIVRGILSDLRRLEQGDLQTAFAALGLRKVDEIEFSDAGSFDMVRRAQRELRMRLAERCGVAESIHSRSSRVEPY